MASGEVATEPEHKVTRNSCVTKFRIEAVHSFEDHEGRIVEKFKLKEVTVWGSLAQYARRLKVGDLVSIQGPLVDSPNGNEECKADYCEKLGRDARR